MSYNYILKYRTLDQLLADVSGDFKKYEAKNLIDPQDLIKVAKRVNYDLGLRINKTKEVLLEVEHNRVRLPNDFYSFNFGLVLADYTVKQYVPQGTHIEERIIGQVVPEYHEAPPEEIDVCHDVELIPEEPVTCTNPALLNPECASPNPCCTNPNSCFLDCKDNVLQLVQTLTYETRYYQFMQPLKILQNTEDLNGFCRGLYWESSFSGELQRVNDAVWLNTSFRTGKVYVNYEGMLEDEQGNLLVPDHDGLNEYYEYALKVRILENLIMNDEETNIDKLTLMQQNLRQAKLYATSIVNTPNFGEIQELFKANRRAQYNKYYSMFASHPFN